MRRVVLLSLAVLSVFGLVHAATVSLAYGGSLSKNFELNEQVPLTVVVSGVPAHVHELYVDLSPDLAGKVYCAPGLVSHDANDQWDAQFTCILLNGSYSGSLYFKPQKIDVDVNGKSLASTSVTRLMISVVPKQVWYTSYGYTNIGGEVSVGGYRVDVVDADVVSADITVYHGDVPVWSGVAFIGQEIKLSDDFVMVFNGYSEKRGEAFFTFKTRFPVSVSSSLQKYYLVVPSPVYAGDSNSAKVDIRTNCSSVSVCDSNGQCTSHSVPGSGDLSVSLHVGSYVVKCSVGDLSSTVKVLPPVVVTKTVVKKVQEDPNKVCPSWFYGLAPAAKMSYCSSVCAPPSRSEAPVSSESSKWVGLAVLLLLVGYFVWKKYKDGGFSFGGSSKSFEETEKEVEAVPDIEG